MTKPGKAGKEAPLIRKFRKNRNHVSLFLIIMILLLEFGLLRLMMPDFVSCHNVLSLFRQASITGILAVGMGFVLISGGLDFSTGSIVAMLGMFAARMMSDLHLPVYSAVLLIVFAGCFIGFVNGLICSYIQIHSFILTTALAVIYRGVANAVNNGVPVYGISEEFMSFDKGTFLALPFPLLILLACLAAGSFLLRKTSLGKYIYAIGLDEKTAGCCGIPVKQIKVIVYTLAGFFYGIASILLLSRIGSAQPTAAGGVELDILAAAAIGGIGFTGGRGRILNIVLGVLIMEILGDTLIIFNVGEFYRNIFKGLVLLSALVVDGVFRRDGSWV